MRVPTGYTQTLWNQADCNCKVVQKISAALSARRLACVSETESTRQFTGSWRASSTITCSDRHTRRTSPNPCRPAPSLPTPVSTATLAPHICFHSANGVGAGGVAAYGLLDGPTYDTTSYTERYQNRAG